MKKIVKICLLMLLMSVSFTACQYENWGENSGPTVDIVERSDLLDIVNLDYILDENRTGQLSASGLTASMKDFRLTGDYTATFNLTLENSAGKGITIPLNCLLSYDKQTANGKDTFSNVKVYWGSVDIFGDDIVITNMNNARVLSAENTDLLKKEMDLSFLDEIGGYALNVAPVGEGYVYAYYSPADCGIAIYSADGSMQKKITLADESIANSFATVTDAFNIETTPLMHIADNGLIYLTGAPLADGDINAFLYDMTNDISYGSNGAFINDDLIADGARYTINHFRNDETGNSIYVAAQYDKDSIDKCFAFEENTNLAFYAKYNGNRLELDENGVLHFVCKNMGIDLAVDFENKTATKQQNITEDILIEKLYTSQDKKYSLYSFGQTDYPNMSTYHVALMENATGKTKYIGFLPVVSGETDVAETGFFSNGEIYLLTGSDFEIFDRNMDNTQSVFAMAENFSLGYNAVEEGVDRYLCAVRRNSDKSFYIVYYDYNWMDNDRYTEGNIMSELKATYQIGLLDKTGKLVSSHDTGVNVQCGTMPVNMYLSGDTLRCSVMYKYTDHSLIKFDFDTNSRKVKITQAYTEPEQW